jgi:hypothetical protein
MPDEIKIFKFPPYGLYIAGIDPYKDKHTINYTALGEGQIVRGARHTSPSSEENPS